MQSRLGGIGMVGGVGNGDALDNTISNINNNSMMFTSGSPQIINKNTLHAIPNIGSAEKISQMLFG